jgi:hypothetical protein
MKQLRPARYAQQMQHVRPVGGEMDIRSPDVGCVQQMETVGKFAFKVICGSINIEQRHPLFNLSLMAAIYLHVTFMLLLSHFYPCVIMSHLI